MKNVDDSNAVSVVSAVPVRTGDDPGRTLRPGPPVQEMSRVFFTVRW
jgi:hypothetical protein